MMIRRFGDWICLFGVLATLAVPACGGSDDGDGDGDGDGDADDGGSSGADDDGQGSTGGCVGAACDDPPPDDNQQGCPTAVKLTYVMGHISGPSMCAGYGPDECAIVDQSGCAVTVECTGFGALTLTIDAAGVSDSVSVPIGDGVVADCHVEVGASPPSLSLVCSAQGIECEWGGSYIECLEDSDCTSFQCEANQCIG
jgi:hypothetical protein